jgi:flagellar basal body P-ring formation protein FlgA
MANSEWRMANRDSGLANRGARGNCSPFAIRYSLFALLYFALSGPAIAQITGSLPPDAGVSSTPALKRAATISSDLVRIGDLVDNAGASARVPIFRAPDLGQTGTVSATRVVEAVRAHGFPIVETGGITEVAVTRASRVVSVKDIEQRIASALAGQSGLGEAKNITVVIERDARPLQLEPSASGELTPTRVYYDPRSTRFDITFELAGSAAARRAALRYVGTAVEMLDAVTLMRPLNRGDIVKPSDLVLERRPRAELRGDAVSAIADAAGLAARRPLRAGEPLRAADLMKADIVQRNETVTIVYQVPGLTLTMRGKALESGAEGDTVNVLNIQSKRTVQGTVSGPGRVTMAATVLPHAVTTSSAIASQPTGEAPRSE